MLGTHPKGGYSASIMQLTKMVLVGIEHEFNACSLKQSTLEAFSKTAVHQILLVF